MSAGAAAAAAVRPIKAVVKGQKMMEGAGEGEAHGPQVQGDAIAVRLVASLHTVGAWHGAPASRCNLSRILHHSLPAAHKPRGVPDAPISGVRICRTVGTPALRNLDPYLMLDELKMPADQASAGFPDHPHRGFETCSIMLRSARTLLPSCPCYHAALASVSCMVVPVPTFVL